MTENNVFNQEVNDLKKDKAELLRLQLREAFQQSDLLRAQEKQEELVRLIEQIDWEKDAGGTEAAHKYVSFYKNYLDNLIEDLHSKVELSTHVKRQLDDNGNVLFYDIPVKKLEHFHPGIDRICVSPNVLKAARLCSTIGIGNSNAFYDAAGVSHTVVNRWEKAERRVKAESLSAYVSWLGTQKADGGGGIEFTPENGFKFEDPDRLGFEDLRTYQSTGNYPRGQSDGGSDSQLTATELDFKNILKNGDWELKKVKAVIPKDDKLDTVLKAALSLRAQGTDTNLLTIGKCLAQLGTLDSVGGLPYLAKLTTGARAHSELKAIQRGNRDQYPPNVALKIHRALSWLAQSEECSDVDGKLLFLWSALSATYANAVDVESENFAAFCGMLLEADTGKLLRAVTGAQFTAFSAELIKNQYLFPPFWEFQRGSISKDAWQSKFEAWQHQFEEAKKSSNALLALQMVLVPVQQQYAQLTQGGATYHSTVNRAQLSDCVTILSTLVSIVVEILMDNPNLSWGPVSFPVIDA